MGKGRHLIIGLLVLVSGAGAVSARAATLYVGDAKDYSVAFKADGADHWAVELAGTADCYFIEPHENVGSTSFSEFPAPLPMHQAPHGLTAGTFGFPEAQVFANFHRNRVSGTYAWEESEDHYHCRTRGRFEARRFEPVGSPEAGAPKRGETRTYYIDKDPIEAFLRGRGDELYGIRGTFVPGCPVGRAGQAGDPLPLFNRPVLLDVGPRGGFRGRLRTAGATATHGTFKEAVTFAGQERWGAVTGSYLRVRTTKPAHGRAERCVTGPLRFEAARFLPAKRVGSDG